MKYFKVALIFVLSVGLNFNALANTNRDIIIDTDAGLDDSMAIAYVLYHRGASVTAISIEADGSNDCQFAYNNLTAITQYFHYSEIPIACGQSNPIEGDNHLPRYIIDFDNKNAAFSLKIPQLTAKKDAIELLFKTIMTAKKQVDILAIGPLTNLSQLFEKYPAVKKNIHQIWIMGGAINVKGNIIEVDPERVNQYAEWNFYIDPTAARNVIDSGVSIVLVPLDITNEIPLNLHVYEMFKAKQNANIYNKFVFNLMTTSTEFIASSHWFFWDPLAAVLMLNPQLTQLAHCQQTKIRVLPSGNKIAEGRILLDNKNGHNVMACYQLTDNEKFYQIFLNEKSSLP